ncbi:hypothetical protein [Vulcanisaeta thermophila]|uniref:hypothetical protein n=1 Tax=Vulcanisaeta thermophila TaxID=867917 RepID=UPI000853B231|nr:hypothetical protein [Vulcanisaeta thermophila]
MLITSALYFIVGLVITTLIIYVATHLMDARDGLGRAFLAALIIAILTFIVGLILPVIHVG